MADIEALEKLMDELNTSNLPEKIAAFSKLLFDAYVGQGFSKEEALELVKAQPPLLCPK